MRLTCNKDAFTKIYRLAAKVAATKHIKDIYQNILLNATSDGVVSLTATDLDSTILAKMEGVTVLEPGLTMLPKGMVGDILATCKDDSLTIAADNNLVSFYGSRFKDIPMQDPAGFPQDTYFAPNAWFEMRTELLSKFVRSTTFATENENTKYCLAGIYIDATEPDYLRFVSTDGRRLSVATANKDNFTVVGDLQDANKIGIMTTESAVAITRIAAENETVKMGIWNGILYAESGGNVYKARMIQGRFPRWKNLIPQIGESSDRTCVSIEAGRLVQVLAEVRIATTAQKPGVLFNFDNNTLRLNAVSPERGASELTIPVSFTGEQNTVKLEPRFVLDFIRTLDPDAEIKVWLKDDQPVLFTCQDYQYLVMPMS